MITLVVLIGTISYGFSITDLTGTKIENTSANTFGNVIITVISTIGSIVSVVVLVVIGIKYMLGSVEEKAVYKTSLLPYVIGCVLVFAASIIAGIIYSLSP